VLSQDLFNLEGFEQETLAKIDWMNTSKYRQLHSINRNVAYQPTPIKD